MSLLQILLIAVGLAMDALAVSIAEGVALRKVTPGHTLRLSLHFGAFQGIMPIFGWLAGVSLRTFIQGVDHWIAFGLLTAIGLKMVADTLFGLETGEPREPSRGGRLLALSIATSIDALAVGISLAMLGVAVWTPAAATGLITGVLCAAGVQMGDRVGRRLGRWAELCGGVILCGIGVKMLVEHLLMS